MADAITLSKIKNFEEALLTLVELCEEAKEEYMNIDGTEDYMNGKLFATMKIAILYQNVFKSELEEEREL